MVEQLGKVVRLWNTEDNPVFSTKLFERAIVFSVKISEPGSCDERDDKYPADGTNAHAHYDSGLICFANEEALQNNTTAIHEFAHILAPHNGHGRKWKAVVEAMGYDFRYPYTSKFTRFWKLLFRKPL